MNKIKINNMIKKVKPSLRYIVSLPTLLLVKASVYADLPPAPNVPGGNAGDSMQTFQNVFNEGAGIVIDILYVVLIIGYVSGIVHLLNKAKEHHKWGFFISFTGGGLLAIVLALIFLNKAKVAIGG